MATIDLNQPQAKSADSTLFSWDLNKNWLVCIDESKSSVLALGHALHLMNSKTDTLHLISVIDKNNNEMQAKGHIAKCMGLIHDNSPEGENIKVQTHVIDGRDPREEICREAAELQVNFIVIGNRGHTGLKKLLLGSVSSYVSQHAHCPVLIVRDDKP